MLFAESEIGSAINGIVTLIVLLVLKWARDELIAWSQNRKLSDQNDKIEEVSKKQDEAEVKREETALELVDTARATARKAEAARLQVERESAEIKRKIAVVQKQTNGLPSYLKAELDHAAGLLETFLATAKTEEKFSPTATVIKSAESLLEKKKQFDSSSATPIPREMTEIPGERE